MEKESKKPIIDVTIRRFFEIKLKQGVEIKKAHIDESKYYKDIYFLQDKHLSIINMSTKKIQKCDVLKGEEVIYISSNSNNDCLLCVLKNGNLYAIDHEKKIKIFKNINVLSLIGNKKKNPFYDKFEIFSNNFLDKIIIVTDVFIVLWYKNNFYLSNNEFNGSFFNLVKENELQKAKINTKEPKKIIVHSKVEVVFSNNFFLGSHAKLFYIITETPIRSQNTKVTILDYLFQFDYKSKFRSVPFNVKEIVDTYHNFYNTEEIEDLNDIRTKISSLNITLKEQESYNSLAKFKIFAKSNVYGNTVCICLNYQNIKNTTIIFFMCETYKFTSCKLSSIIGDKLDKDSEISNIDWLASDMFLMILFTNGTFLLFNINFQIILLNDLSNFLLPDDFYYTPMFYNINKIKPKDNARLITSKQRDDVFFIYSNNYGIAFQINYKSLENRLVSIQIPNENFLDFLYEIKYFQLYLTSCDVEISPDVDIDMNVFDIIHKYFANLLAIGIGNVPQNSNNLISNTATNQKMTITTKDLYTINSKENKENLDKPNIDTAKLQNSSQKSETVNNLIRTFVKFIRIFNSINQIHETNLTIVTYVIKKAQDFLIHLINHQEIWLAVLFLNLSEKYICDYLQLFPHTTSKTHSSSQIQKIVFNPYIHENVSFNSYRYPCNKQFFSRMRLVLVFFFLFEFRNTFALNINVLYFVLAKLLIKKFIDNDMLEEVLNVSRIIVKNYKYLKQENDKVGKDEFVLNSISMSYKNEIFSDIQITPVEREDLNFDFFSEFYSIDEFINFNETNKNYIKNEEMESINDFNYLNNVGILQKWIIYFTNYLYSELFSDFRNYLQNHFKQTLSQNKNEANTSPEEKTLSKLIYFNINFFLQTIQYFLKQFFNIIIQKKETNDINIHLFENFNIIYLNFISPIDIPFMIFEFYIQETNQNQKTLPFEINYNLSKLISQRGKQYNMTIDDALNFIDFLESNDFKFENNIDYTSNSGLINNDDYRYFTKLQSYLYSGFLFYIFIIHKLNLVYLLEKEKEMLLAIMDCLDTSQKKECYEYLLLIVNGQLRYYLKINSKQKLNESEGAYIEIILSFLKEIFYKMLREEPYEIRNNIFDFIRLTPTLMKSYLLEGAMYYEYKNFNKLIKNKLFSFNEIVQTKNIILKKNSIHDINIFDVILRDDDHNNNELFTFPTKLTEQQDYHFQNNLNISLINLLNLCLIPSIGKIDNKELNSSVNNELIFSLEKDKSYVKQLILRAVEDETLVEDNVTDNIIHIALDKIVKGNFENKKYFKFSNNELKSKLIFSIKCALVKFLHLCNVLLLKHKVSTCNGKENEILFLKYVSYCLLYEKNYQFSFDCLGKILNVLNQMNLKEIKYENDKYNFVEILKNVHIASLKYKKNDYMDKNLSNIEIKMEQENPSIKEKYILFLSEDFQKISKVYEKIKNIKSQNLKWFSLSLFSDFYLDSLYSVYDQITTYLKKANTCLKEPLRIARKKYIKLAENMYSITGIPVTFFMDFSSDWNLAENNELYKSIISDEIEDYQIIPPKEKEGKTELMNRRQTPKRRRNQNKENEGNNSNRSLSKKRRPRADSLDIREESSNLKVGKGIKTIKKIPKFILKKEETNISEIKSKEETKKESENNIKLINITNISSNTDKEIKEPSIEVILLKEKFVIILYYIIILLFRPNNKYKQNHPLIYQKLIYLLQI